MFDEPLVGFSCAADPLYAFFRRDIGDPYETPVDLFRKAFPDRTPPAKDLSIISWVLPITRRTKDDNRKETIQPSERWARTRLYGEQFNAALALHVAGALNAQGIDAFVPALSPAATMGISKKYGMAASWSERHAAYVSGLGTFGLCDGFITRKGKAMRCGSVIARTVVPPTPRAYTGHQDWCLFYAKGACKACMKRCPAGAITEHGHDKNRCREYLFGTTRPYIQENYRIDIYGCGLCQTGVPCESKNPVQEK
jgi:epoxyqueuosine reductase QueG